MSNSRIQKKFINGVHKVYRKLFSDTVFYVPQLEGVKDELYDEYVSQSYGTPVPLIAKIQLTPEFDEVPVKEQRYTANFVFTFKSLRDNDINVVDHNNHTEIRKGFIEYCGVKYTILSIDPMTFVADAFITYSFKCVERK